MRFEHDCREGICGSCGFLVNGQAHGPRAATSVCQFYLREFNDGAVLTLGPWRAKLAHLGQLPQGQPERASRADAMQRQMEAEGFGSCSCSSNLECEAVCPQEISADWISWMHRERRS